MFYKFLLCLVLMILGIGLVVHFNPNTRNAINEWFAVGFMLLGASSVLTTQFLWKYWR